MDASQRRIKNKRNLVAVRLVDIYELKSASVYLRAKSVTRYAECTGDGVEHSVAQINLLGVKLLLRFSHIFRSLRIPLLTLRPFRSLALILQSKLKIKCFVICLEELILIILLFP